VLSECFNSPWSWAKIFFDYPANSAIDEGDVISPERAILSGVKMSRIGFMKGSATGFCLEA
jgi:hypothetical protein